MGYTTKFVGAFPIIPALSVEHLAEYDRLVETERDEMPAGAPNAYLQWVVSEDGARLHWDGEEKFYNYEEWLEWLAREWFGPRGYVLSGKVRYQGEEIGDTGELEIAGHLVTKTQATYGDPIAALREILRRYEADVLEVEDAAELARTALKGSS